MARSRSEIQHELEQAKEELSYQELQLQEAESQVSFLMDQVEELEQELAEVGKAPEKEEQ